MKTPQTTARLLEDPTAIVALTVGYDQLCAVLSGGALQCWGGNDLSQCGVGASTATVAPTEIARGIASVSAGFNYSCAVRSDGTALCWGAANHGQVGNEDGSIDEKTPTAVSGATGLVAISASSYLTCGIASDGGVLCWGSGPLGDGTTNESATPVRVQGLTGRVTQLAAGGSHACALLADGAVVCWGDGGYGALGRGLSVGVAFVPGAVPGVSPAKAISSSEYGSCAVLADGTVSCWGNDSAYSSGSFVPVAVPGIGGAVAVASGLSHECALLESGKVVCWGDNTSGQLGDGTTTARGTPVEVKGLP
jgi:alpha-tubulin suppressor-like RCC1 family protein